MLEKEYRKNSDAEFSKRMDYYKRNQPGEEYNELHSIIGTEFADISPQLEDYYKDILIIAHKLLLYTQNTVINLKN